MLSTKKKGMGWDGGFDLKYKALSWQCRERSVRWIRVSHSTKKLKKKM